MNWECILNFKIISRYPIWFSILHFYTLWTFYILIYIIKKNEQVLLSGVQIVFRWLIYLFFFYCFWRQTRKTCQVFQICANDFDSKRSLSYWVSIIQIVKLSLQSMATNGLWNFQYLWLLLGSQRQTVKTLYDDNSSFL